jgi:predicted alpha/beta-hydrolase family hydrolase
MTSFVYLYNSKASVLDVIMHGGSADINAPFMQKVFELSRSKGNSAIMFNFPFIERGEDHSSGPQLKEELETLRQMLIFVKAENYSHIRLIGKSLGGIVASYFLNNLPLKDQKKFEAIILGFVVGDINLDNFSGKITVIQGENDKFGGIKAVEDALRKAKSKDVRYYEVKGADHSFRDPQTKEPLYENKVFEILSSF